MPDNATPTALTMRCVMCSSFGLQCFGFQEWLALAIVILWVILKCVDDSAESICLLCDKLFASHGSNITKRVDTARGIRVVGLAFVGSRHQSLTCRVSVSHSHFGPL